MFWGGMFWGGWGGGGVGLDVHSTLHPCVCVNVLQ